jgi:hypothetical protein
LRVPGRCRKRQCRPQAFRGGTTFGVAVEILADNAAPEADAVYAALGMPFGGLVYGLKQYFSRG